MRNFLLLLLFLAFSAFTIACTSRQTTSAECIDQNKIKTDVFCTEHYDPVCGCDGKTYSNACFADIAGVTSFKKGECP